MHDFILLFLVYGWVMFFDEYMQIFYHFDPAFDFQWAWNKVATVPPNLPRSWQKRRNETKKIVLEHHGLWCICNSCMFTFPRLCGCGCSSSILKGWFLVQKRSSIIISSTGFSLIFIVLDQISCMLVRFEWEFIIQGCSRGEKSSTRAALFHQVFRIRFLFEYWLVFIFNFSMAE